MSLAKGLSILFIFSKIQFLLLFMFNAVSFFFHLLLLGSLCFLFFYYFCCCCCCSFSSCFRCKVQFSSVTQLCPALCDPMDRSTPGLPVHHQLPEFIQTHVHRVGDAIQPFHPLLSPFPPARSPFSIRVFSNESTLHTRWPKYWSFSFSIIPSKEHPGLISFRMDWLDLLAVQGTLKSLLQHHSSK